MKQSKKIGLIIAVVVLLIAAVLGFMTMSLHKDVKEGQIVQNIEIDQVAVGNMTKEQAKEAVEAYVKDVKKANIILKAGEKQAQIKVKNTGIVFNVDQAVEDAYSVGRDGNIVSKFFKVKKLKKETESITLAASISEEDAKKVLEKKEKGLILKTQNASLKRKDGKFEVIDEVAGQKIVYEKSVESLVTAVTEGWDKRDVVVKVSVKKEEPKYKAEDLKDVKDVLGTYGTSYASSGYSRSRNVENGCSKINGTMLYPGETLSVYKAVSPFTGENGYYLAGSYNNGEVVETYGGGICQVSTTLYNAVLRAELEIAERSNHSMVVTYVPLAADAAIAGTHKDFKFKNNSDTPIYIEGTAGGGSLRFTIYGKETRDKKRSIEFVSKTISVSAPGKDIETKDPTLEEGKKIVTQSAQTGYVAQLWKIIYEDGKEVKRVKVNTSQYNSSPRRVTVGTKKKEKDKKTENSGQGTTEAGSETGTTAANSQKTTTENQ